MPRTRSSTYGAQRWWLAAAACLGIAAVACRETPRSDTGGDGLVRGTAMGGPAHPVRDSAPTAAADTAPRADSLRRR